MEEIWKPVKDFENFYEVSDLGRLRSKDRDIICKNGKRHSLKGKIIKPIVCTNKYLEYVLHRNNIGKIILAHRLVAQAFIPNPDNKPEVNHKDENIQNNHVDNLEWVTSKENANYGTRNYKCRECNRRFFKSVSKYDKNWNFLNSFETLKEAGDSVNGDPVFISRVCKGKQRSAYGYYWKFN